MYIKKEQSMFVFVLLMCMMYQSVVLKAEDPMEVPQKANHLIDETSPYLLLHAHNPVDWYPWCEEAFKRAKRDNKLVIISIGYSACHWCHVMEKESFQDTAVAEMMNTNFISIKIDREERMDLDQLYMHAAYLLTGKGGWPLHVIALPDGRPIYAGTYYPKEKWMLFLNKINTFYKENPEKAEEMAEAITEGIRKLDALKLDTETSDLSTSDLDTIYEKWKNQLDELWGGRRGAPKFPMPIGIEFLLRYHFLTQRPGVLDAVRTNLDRMALGGIYDQIGGGFARYSVDALWKVPHFEKMLYDNAQLISLYAAAYQLTKDPLYKDVVYQTIEFVRRELTSPEGGFYASLDADSDGEEGKYYVWTRDEIEETLGKQAPVILDYYHIHEDGNWKDGKNVLYRRYRDALFARKHGMPIETLKGYIGKAREKLFEKREKRVRPAVDDKILTSWNALMLKALIDAYRVFNEETFLKLALKQVYFLQDNVVGQNGKIRRSYKDGKSTINGFLDDYALMIQAYLGFYQATFDENWLSQADMLAAYVIKHFYNKEEQFFYYTSDLDSGLIARKMEIPDHVIPSSNSVMAHNFFLLGKILDRADYLNYSKNMLLRVKSHLASGGPYYGNWSRLLIDFVSPLYEVVIVGKEADQKRQGIDVHYLPNVILMGSKKKSQLPLLQDRFVDDLTMVYVCRDKTCQLPVETVKEALQQIK